MNDEIADALAALVPAPASAPLAHREAKALALASLTGDPFRHPGDADATAALAALATRNRELIHGGADAIRDALADQAVVLEALLSAFAYEAGRTRRTDQKIALASIALKASGQLGAALALLHRVNEDKRNAEALPAY